MVELKLEQCMNVCVLVPCVCAGMSVSVMSVFPTVLPAKQQTGLDWLRSHVILSAAPSFRKELIIASSVTSLSIDAPHAYMNTSVMQIKIVFMIDKSVNYFD